MRYASAAVGALFIASAAQAGCASRNDGPLTSSVGPTSATGAEGADAGFAASPPGTFVAGDASTGVFVNDAAPSVDASMPSVLTAAIRDFKFYDANDPTTDPDFENPPNDGASSWDDHYIVTSALGADGKPVYANATGTTLTTHGKASFDEWYNDVANSNIHVDYPIPLSQQADGSYGYDSSVSGVPYDIPEQTGDGFFPIDDGSPYATAFGDQGAPHNYSFTVELHTVFTYRGGEYFSFRGDDDVFVYINGALVIDLGIHGPETQMVDVDTLGLTAGQAYPLDFFSAERHVTGSNIKFETTLDLAPAPK